MANPTIQQIVDYSRKTLPLAEAKLSDEYYYQSLPLCAIDAVFSIGVRYGATRNVVERFCRYARTERYRPHGSSFPEPKDQLSISQFLKCLDGKDPDVLAEEVFGNRQRTSARSGILKAKAVILFAKELHLAGIDCFQDLTEERIASLEPQIVKIPGQSSLISFGYFQMLAGDDSRIKPDRMIMRFLAEATGQSFERAGAITALQQATQILAQEYPTLTARGLDHEIWKYARDEDAEKSSKKGAA